MYKEENKTPFFSVETNSIKRPQSVQFKDNRLENTTQLKAIQMAKNPPKRSKAPSFSTMDGWRIVTSSRNYATPKKIRHVRESIPVNKEIIDAEGNEYLDTLDQTRKRSDRAKRSFEEGNPQFNYLKSKIEKMDLEKQNFEGLTIQEARRRKLLRKRFNSGSVKWNTPPREEKNNATFTSTDGTFHGHIHRDRGKSPGNAWVPGIKYFELSMDRYKSVLQKYVTVK